MNLRAILNVVGILLILLAVILILPVAVSLYYDDPALNGHMGETTAFGWTAFLSGAFGLALWKIFPPGIDHLRDREGFAIVGFSWIAIVAFGALPMYLSGACPRFVDAYFETMSGFTTSGASILTMIDGLPHGILFWRNLMQWMGGMGIILLSLFSLWGMRDMHTMNGLKSGMSFVISAISVATFAIAGIIRWPEALMMALASVAGGFAGASLARVLGRRIVRIIVIITGLTMSTIFFLRIFW